MRQGQGLRNRTRRLSSDTAFASISRCEQLPATSWPRERAADIILNDCSPHEDVLMRNATLRETVQFRTETRAQVIADIREARR
jgi:hypothetical protein